MIGGLAMLAMATVTPIEGVERFDLARLVAPRNARAARRTAAYLLPDVDDPEPPEKPRLRVRGRMLKWRVPLGSF
ncbi:MAG: hypothetical protein PGN09_02675 [Sphingomonas fennica]